MAERKYWKGLEEKTNSTELAQRTGNEFPQELPLIDDLGNEKLGETSSSRRDFLKFMGFSVTAATVAASCEMPVRKAIPYVVKPDDIIPGIANYYASTFMDGANYCSVVVKTRDGRPIKIEGNKLSNVTFGGTDAIAQASILNLYDGFRLKGPSIDKKEVSWKEVDSAITGQLEKLAAEGGNFRILSSTVISPSTKKVIADFTAKYPNTRHITYDGVSCSGLLDAAEKSFGKRAIPSYRFDNANLIVSFGADFLGTWVSPITFASQYAKTRKVSKTNPSMSRHVQVESYLSMTGSNADKRVVVKPSQEDAALLYVYNKVAAAAGTPAAGSANVDDTVKAHLDGIAEELIKAAGKSLVVSGSTSEDAQVIANAINIALGNIGTTVDVATQSNMRQGSDKDFNQLLADMNSGSVQAVIVMDANPVYTSPKSAEFKSGLAKVALTVSLSDRMDETTELCTYDCPNHNFLEAWNDAEPVKGHFSLGQPTISPLFNTRHAAESLLRWSGSNVSYYDYIRANWQQNIFTQQNKFTSFDHFWDKSLQDGVFEISNTATSTENTASNADVVAAGSAIAKASNASGTEIVLYQKVGIQDGTYAGNPWLQELPDPVSKITWDNYAAVSLQFAKDNGFQGAVEHATMGKYNTTDVITVKAAGYEVALPVVVQPGTPANTIAIALGYGRKIAGKAGTDIGADAYPFVQFDGKNYIYKLSGASFEKTGGDYLIAQTQYHHTIDDGLNKRPIVKETTLGEYKANPFAGNEDRKEVQEHLQTLYGYHEELETGHHWGMAIDLNSCIGCGACVIACHAENNVPAVGKEEVALSREMHWLRIDRYYAGDENNPSVIFQPMMCQHCDNAPCENVCPVAATNHSSEGLNQMAYNRCIGTRYCANNCPYKVRRFNWFDYQNSDSFQKGTIFDNEHDLFGMTEDLTRMVLNPDVTIRSRGVMEKCSFCVQRIQEGKLNAKNEGRKVRDGEIVSACMAACTTGAITFGDVNDKGSQVTKLTNDERTFKVIEEIHTLPSVAYLTKVRNKSANEA